MPSKKSQSLPELTMFVSPVNTIRLPGPSARHLGLALPNPHAVSPGKLITDPPDARRLAPPMLAGPVAVNTVSVPLA
jgi:hypothetical protein